MTTPSDEVMKDPKKFKQFVNEYLKPKELTEEEFQLYLDRTSKTNPANNPNNPWVRKARKMDGDI